MQERGHLFARWASRWSVLILFATIACGSAPPVEQNDSEDPIRSFDCDGGFLDGVELPYNGVDDDCDPVTPDDDLDGDGWELADDCDDTDPLAGGGNETPFNGIDDDCDPETHDDDGDQDGFILVDDCDDTDPNAWEDGVFVGDVDSSNGVDFCSGYCVRDIEGDLSVSTFMQDVDCVTSVSGSVSARTTMLQDLSCLSSLVSIGGDLTLASNGQMGSLDGLESLAVVGGRISLTDNDLLIDLSSLSGLASASGLNIQHNIQLSSLSGHEGLNHLEYVWLNDNDALVDLAGLNNVTEITGLLSVKQNDALVDLSALADLTILGELLVWYNASLLELAQFQGLTTIPGWVAIYNNESMTDISGMSALQCVDELGSPSECDVRWRGLHTG